jgi:uptake hydrogenase large subunit
MASGPLLAVLGTRALNASKAAQAAERHAGREAPALHAARAAHDRPDRRRANRLDRLHQEWLALESAEDFDAWLEAPAHRDSAVGVFTRFGRSIGLEELGKGTPHLLSTGSYYDPEQWQPPFRERPCLHDGGFYDGVRDTVEPFRHAAVSEHLRFSRFVDPGSPRHPWESQTVPEDVPGEAYSYAKATRYDDHVVQLGPLADLVLAGDPLITSLFRKQGAGTWLRQFTRLHRPVATFQAMRETVAELRAHLDEPTFIRSEAQPDGDGFGAINAARGSLAHWVRIRDGEIANYQVITPTAWNGSPRDGEGRRGHWEESFVGLEIRDLDNPVELFHIVRSHDACLVCTVHVAGGTGGPRAFSFS